MSFAAREQRQNPPAETPMRERVRPRDAKVRLAGEADRVMARLKIAMAKLQDQIAKPGSQAALDKLKSKNEDLQGRASTLLQALQSGKIEDHHLSEHGIDYEHEEMNHDALHHPELSGDFKLLHELAGDVRMLDQRVQGYHNHHRPRTGMANAHVQMGAQQMLSHGHHHHLPEDTGRRY